MNITWKILWIALCLLTIGCIMSVEKKYNSDFHKLNKLEWENVFSDNCRENWEEKWFKDGINAYVMNNEKGMTVVAGERHFHDSDHVVMWTKREFEGDIKIEYDFTRLDTVNNFVNIIYFLAQGSGMAPYVTDIEKWSDLRTEPAMNIYFDHMNIYHISYAVSSGIGSGGSEYIRARRYIPETRNGLKGTALLPEYSGEGLFELEKTYRITVIKKDVSIYMNVKNSSIEKTFYFDASTLPNIDKGRIGLRQMHARISRYANFNVYQIRK